MYLRLVPDVSVSQLIASAAPSRVSHSRVPRV